MSIELFTAEKLLEMALGGIAGNAASEGVKRLWQAIKNRLGQNQPVIEAEIVELEQNPSQEKLKSLEPFLQVEMYKDKLFAEEISKLAQEISKASSTSKHFEAKDQGVAAETINAPKSRIGGSDTHIHLGKN